MINIKFSSLQELAKAFPDQQSCIDHLEKIRWDGNVVSPFDPFSKVYKCPDNKYKCKNTRKYFNVKTRTLFDNTRVPLQKWFITLWIFLNQEKAISSVELGKRIGVSQKTAWLMLQKLGLCFGTLPESQTI